jgi:hypothetical protein
MSKDQIEEGQTTQCPHFYLISWHCVVYPSSIWSVYIVLSVLLLFDLFTLCCLSFFYLICWHCVVCPSSIWSVGIVLSALLLFDLLALCCLSFFYLICWHCVVCPSSIWSFDIVLSVLLLFDLLALCCLSNANRTNRRRADNTMTKDQIEEGQTTQCQKIK